MEWLRSSGRYSFSRREAETALTSSSIAVQSALRRLKKKGRIAAPRRGFYVIVPPEYRVAGCWAYLHIPDTSPMVGISPRRYEMDTIKKRKPRRRFTDEFKADAVRLVTKEKLSFARVATDLDVHETSLRSWVKQAETDAGRGTPGSLTTDERRELAKLRRENRILREEREIPKKGGSFLREGVAVSERYRFIDAEKAQYPIVRLCRVMQVSTSGFYGRRAAGPSRRSVENLRLTERINAVAESFFASPKTELEVIHTRVGRDAMQAAVIACLVWFNNHRLHSTLDYHSPADYERASRARQQVL